MSQVKLAAARELIQEKKYAEARALLLTIRDDPTAARWLAKLDERTKQIPQNYTVIPAPTAQAQTYDEPYRARQYPAPAQPPPVEKTGVAGVFRIVWGILTLLALGWICYGITTLASVTGEQLNTTEAQASAGYQAGTVIGGGIGLTVVLCTGVPALLIFGILYWRNGVAIRETKKHNQMVDAMRR